VLGSSSTTGCWSDYSYWWCNLFEWLQPSVQTGKSQRLTCTACFLLCAVCCVLSAVCPAQGGEDGDVSDRLLPRRRIPSRGALLRGLCFLRQLSSCVSILFEAYQYPCMHWLECQLADQHHCVVSGRQQQEVGCSLSAPMHGICMYTDKVDDCSAVCCAAGHASEVKKLLSQYERLCVSSVGQT
jgi:hypothetical protein